MNIFNEYKLSGALGSGAFGEVWKAIHIQSNKEVAIKIDFHKKTNNLKKEAIILRFLKKCTLVPKLIYYGKTNSYNFLIIDLLDQTVFSYFDSKIKNLDSKLSSEELKERKCNLLKWIGLKMLECIKQVHQNGIVHMDIKPENFLMTKDNNNIKIIDFGLSRKYLDLNGQHKMNKYSNKLSGTIRYLSCFLHDGYNGFRRDDLVSFVYSLIFIFENKLPWQDVKCKNKYEKIEAVYKIKSNISNHDLTKNISPKMTILIDYVYSLEYNEDPDYEFIKTLFDLLI